MDTNTINNEDSDESLYINLISGGTQKINVKSMKIETYGTTAFLCICHKNERISSFYNLNEITSYYLKRYSD